MMSFLNENNEETEGAGSTQAPTQTPARAQKVEVREADRRSMWFRPGGNCCYSARRDGGPSVARPSKLSGEATRAGFNA